MKGWDSLGRACECSGNNFSNEMPLLRVNVGGNESTYEGEDEDVPPRLSPNFALVCFFFCGIATFWHEVRKCILISYLN